MQVLIGEHRKRHQIEQEKKMQRALAADAARMKQEADDKAEELKDPAAWSAQKEQRKRKSDNKLRATEKMPANMKSDKKLRATRRGPRPSVGKHVTFLQRLPEGVHKFEFAPIVDEMQRVFKGRQHRLMYSGNFILDGLLAHVKCFAIGIPEKHYDRRISAASNAKHGLVSHMNTTTLPINSNLVSPRSIAKMMGVDHLATDADQIDPRFGGHPSPAPSRSRLDSYYPASDTSSDYSPPPSASPTLPLQILTTGNKRTTKRKQVILKVGKRSFDATVREVPDDGNVMLALVLSYYATGTHNRRHDYAFVVKEKEWMDTGFAEWAGEEEWDADEKNSALCRAVTEEVCTHNGMVSSKPVKIICKRFNMGQREIRAFMQCFREMDSDGSGSIDIFEMIRFLSLDTSLWALAELVFSRFDTDGNSILDQCEFICGFTMYCGFDWSSMIEFFFRDFQVRGKDLTRAQLEKALQAVHGGPSMLILKPVVQIFLNETCKYPVSMRAFKKYARNIPTLLAPAFTMQDKLRSKIFGEEYWLNFVKEAQRLVDKNDGDTLLEYLKRLVGKAQAQVRLYLEHYEDKQPAAEEEVGKERAVAKVQGPEETYIQQRLEDERKAGDLDQQMLEHLKANMVRRTKVVEEEHKGLEEEEEASLDSDDDEEDRGDVDGKTTSGAEGTALVGASAEGAHGEGVDGHVGSSNRTSLKMATSLARRISQTRRASLRRASLLKPSQHLEQSVVPMVELSPSIILQHYRNSEASLDTLRGKIHDSQIEYFEEHVRDYKAQVKEVLQEVKQAVDQAVAAAVIDMRALGKWVDQRQDTLSPLQRALVYKAFENKAKFTTSWKQKQPPKGRPNTWREKIFLFVRERGRQR
jgi:hypothetical protein